MDDPYMVTFVALRQGMINNLKLCWAGVGGADSTTMDNLAISIADVLLELSPDPNADAATAIYADARLIAKDVIASSTRQASIERLRPALAARG